jgi:hypothetical protein
MILIKISIFVGMKEAFSMNYEGWGMMPAQDFMYPVEYHERYGYMYPSMEPEMNNGMVQPIMYPDIYYRIYPYVHRTCDRMDNPYMMYPSEAQVESMVNDCYDNCVNSMPDMIQYADMQAEKIQEVDASQFRRRPLLRDLISIILISELFRRRRFFNDFGRGRGFGISNDGGNSGYGYAAGYGGGNNGFGYSGGNAAGYGQGYGGYAGGNGAGNGPGYGQNYGPNYGADYGPGYGAGY